MSAAQRTRNAALAALRQARRLVVAVIGLTVLAVGVAMLILPGPAFVVIPIGLGILATEFVWAQRLLHNLKERAGSLARRATGGGSSSSTSDSQS